MASAMAMVTGIPMRMRVSLIMVFFPVCDVANPKSPTSQVGLVLRLYKRGCERLLESLAGLCRAGNDVELALCEDRFLNELRHRGVIDACRGAAIFRIIEDIYVGQFSAGDNCRDLHIAEIGIHGIAVIGTVNIESCCHGRGRRWLGLRRRLRRGNLLLSLFAAAQLSHLRSSDYFDPALPWLVLSVVLPVTETEL